MRVKARIRVAIIDDHPLLRRGLNEIINESGDMEVAGEAGDSAQALHLLRKTPCDVVLLDIVLPGRTGLETLQMIRSEFPEVHVLMVSNLPENKFAAPALKAGASGYVDKQCAVPDLVDAIRTVHSGGKYVKPQDRFPPRSTVMYFPPSDSIGKR